MKNRTIHNRILFNLVLLHQFMNILHFTSSLNIASSGGERPISKASGSSPAPQSGHATTILSYPVIHFLIFLQERNLLKISSTNTAPGHGIIHRNEPSMISKLLSGLHTYCKCMTQREKLSSRLTLHNMVWELWSYNVMIMQNYSQSHMPRDLWPNLSKISDRLTKKPSP